MLTLKRINRIMWPLVVLVVVAVAWLWFEGRRDRELFKPGSGCVNVHPQEASAFLEAHPETQVLDVRSAAEVSGGTLPGARHVSIGDAQFEEKLQALDPAKPVLVYCAGGFRSRKAAAVLKRLGFSNIQHLHRGYQSWRLSGLPITQLSHPD
jgi:rhodanese-related sulfurtransferase